MENKKNYWLKLDKDFFKHHDIRIIESMSNGKDYIIFYLKLLCESITHNGELRFSAEIPYNEQMLSSITNTNVDIVRSAIKVFTELKMMKILDDGTLYIERVKEMTGVESKWAEYKRIERFDEKKNKLIELYSKRNKNNLISLSIDDLSTQIENSINFIERNLNEKNISKSNFWINFYNFIKDSNDLDNSDVFRDLCLKYVYFLKQNNLGE